MGQRVVARSPVSGVSLPATQATHKKHRGRKAGASFLAMAFGVRTTVGRVAANGSRFVPL